MNSPHAPSASSTIGPAFCSTRVIEIVNGDLVARALDARDEVRSNVTEREA